LHWWQAWGVARSLEFVWKGVYFLGRGYKTSMGTRPPGIPVREFPGIPGNPPLQKFPAGIPGNF